ncbi:MAG: hypothetical protein M1812_006573 [Candelaria pacifica]|nr:MAG: hypothetical protein M1812_006573 [Candelaria pacifica]
MASNREERFQMRQRGAGTHKIKDIAFALAFPTVGDALPPQRSSRSGRTPQQESQPLRPQRSTRRTPQPTQQPLPSQRSSRRTPGPVPKSKVSPNNVRQTDDVANESTSKVTRGSSQGSVAKKRKLTGPTPAQTTPSINDPPSSSTRSQSVVGNRSNISQVAAPSDVGSSVVSNRRRSLRSSSSLESPPTETQNTNLRLATADPKQPMSRRNEKGSSIQKSKPGSTIAASRSKQPLKDSTNTKGKADAGKAHSRPQRSSSLVEIENTLPEGEVEDESPQVQSRGRGRPRKSLPTVEEEQDDVEAPPKKPPPASTKSRPQRSKTFASTGSAVTADRSKARPTSSAPTKSTRARTSDISDASTLARRPSVKDSVPITVHRLSQPQALKDSAGKDSSTASAPSLIKRSGVNPIDVLGQICKELIARLAESLQRGSVDQGNEMRRGAATRKRKAVEAFGIELEQRLFEMTEALDNNYALSMRVKQANKEKIALREEFLRIRDERHKVALRMDEVRRVHGQEAKAAQERNDLNTAFNDIELAVERGRAAQQAVSHDYGEQEPAPVGLELLLRTVAASVSSRGDGGGLLSQVKEFNGFLERVATVLENRP